MYGQLFSELYKFLILSGVGLTLPYLIDLSKHNKLANSTLSNKKDFNKILGTDGLIISKNIQMKEKFDFEGTCILGPTGSGKTTSFFFPNLLSNNIKGSIIVTDPKGELFNATSKYQNDICKRKVYKFSPLSPSLSERYNLLENCKTSSEVIQLASTLLMNGALSIELQTGKKANGIEWVQMAEPLLAAALLYVKDLDFPFNTIDFAFQLIISLSSRDLKQIFLNSENEDCITQFRIFYTVGAAEKTEGSIKITLASNMKLFCDNNINLSLLNTTFDIESFRKEPSILYITYPENKSSYLAPLIAPFFSQILDRLIDSYNRKALPITLFFDEFANIGMLNNMSTNVSTCRSRKISFNICLQSVTQLYQIYGRDLGKAILNNLKTKIILPGMNDIDTLEYISQLCGRTEIDTQSISISNNNCSKNSSKTTKNLFDKDELRCLKQKELLIVCSNLFPLKDFQECYYENETYIKNIFPDKVKYSKKYLKKIDYSDKIQDLMSKKEVRKVKKITAEDLLN